MSAIKWKVAPEPTGRGRGFEKRKWPTAWYKNPSKPCAFISCEDAYEPSQAAMTCPTHAALTVTMCHHNHPEAGNSWKLLRAKERPASLAAAKRLVERILLEHPEFAPAK